MDKVVLEAKEITKYFHDPMTVKVLDKVSFTLNQSEFVSVIGRSGCGKSTLLYILSTMDTDYEGEPDEYRVQREEYAGSGVHSVCSGSELCSGCPDREGVDPTISQNSWRVRSWGSEFSSILTNRAGPFNSGMF